MLHDTNGIVNGILAFLRPGQLKQSATWLFFIIGHHWLMWCWYIINGTTAYLSHDDQNEVQYEVFGHMTPLALASASHDTDGIVNGNTAFLRSTQLKWGATSHLWLCDAIGIASVSHDANGVVNGNQCIPESRQWKWDLTWLFWLCYAIGTSMSITWCWQHCQWNHYIPYVQMTKMTCNMTCYGYVMPLILVSVSHDTNNVTAFLAFLRSRWMKWSATWPFWSYDAISTDISITWCWWCHQRHHWIPYIKMIDMRCNIRCHLHQHPMTPMALSMAHDTDASTSISSWHKKSLILPNNHPHMTNAMVPLMVLSATCDRKHVIARYVPKN